MSLPNIEIHIRTGIWQIYKKQGWPTFFDANIQGKVSNGSGLAAGVSAYKKRASLLTWGSWLSASCVWLVAQYHFQLYHIDPDFLFALGAIEREIYQDRILRYFCPCFAPANRTVNPMRIVPTCIHTITLSKRQLPPCDKRLALEIAILNLYFGTTCPEVASAS